jgi:ABC-2 type transport system ATP-binding protein
MIEVEGLVKRYGEVLAVQGISFRIGEGEVVGFLGPNGAGKSTTLRILTGYMPATAGSVRIAGFDVLTRSLEVRRRLGYLPENVPVYPEMRVEEFLRFRALLKGVPRRDLAQRVESALERCGCREMRRRMIGTLSKGYRQRVGIADAVVHDPPILILDEPTSGLDPNQRVEVRRLIASLGAEKTVILSTHILAEVEAVARRVVIVHRGRIAADGTPDQLAERFAGETRLSVAARGSRDALLAALRAVPGVASATARQGDELESGVAVCDVSVAAGADPREAIAAAVAAAGLPLRELHRETADLEAIFRRLTVEDAA